MFFIRIYLTAFNRVNALIYGVLRRKFMLLIIFSKNSGKDPLYMEMFPLKFI